MIIDELLDMIGRREITWFNAARPAGITDSALCRQQALQMFCRNMLAIDRSRISGMRIRRDRECRDDATRLANSSKRSETEST